MGTLTYNSKLTVSLDDRVLAHLQAVMWSKLRRGEYFSFTWTGAASGGIGRTSVWMAPSIPVEIEFFGGRAPKLNPAWIQVLAKSANSAGGLTILPEPSNPEG